MNITERFVGTARLLVLSLVAGLVVLFPVVQVQPAAASIDTSQLAFNDQVCDLTAAGYEGTGAEEDPYKISDSDSLWEVADCDITTSGKAHFHLTKDINVADAVDAPTASPIGQSTSSLVYSFSGELYGNGNSIRGISISSSTHGVGLFGYIYGAIISDLSITGEIFSSSTEGGAGGIAAIFGGNVLLDQISSSVKVTAYGLLGGLIGVFSDSGKVTIVQSSNFGDITGQSAFVGGLLGYADEVEIRNSTNRGSVSTSKDAAASITNISAAGGLIGAAESQISIEDSANFHTVSATGHYVGGLVGAAAQELIIERSTNSGNVISGTGSIGIGGIVGAGGVSSTTSILSSVNSGFVDGTSDVGGLIGQDQFDAGNPNKVTQILNSQNFGGISGAQNVGGFIGKASSKVTIFESKNDSPVSGGTRVGGLIGKSTYSANISGSNTDGSVLGNDHVGGFIGQATGSLVVTSSQNAASVIGNGGGSFRVGGLVGDVYMLSAEGFQNTGTVSGSDSVGGVAGISLKRGSFISTVNSATISGSTNIGGIVGYVGDSNGFAADDFLAYLSINEGPVVGTAQYVGGIAAQVNAVNSTISESLNRASIYGLSAVGGLVGYTAKDLEVAFSFNTGTVSGNIEVGGMIGNSQADTSYLETVYSAGNINASSQFDGLVGVVATGKTVSAQAAYTVEPSNFGSQVGLAQMQSADTFNSFDFSATWGFGSCTDNLGLPMLRLLGEISSYNSVACGYAPPQPPAQNTPASAPAPVLQQMPVIDQTRISSAPLGQALVTGEKFELILSASVGSLRATISELSATSFVITIPNLEAGIFSLELETTNGRISYQGLVEVLQSSGNVDESENQPVVLPTALEGANPWSSWLNKSLLSEIEELVAGQEVVTCVTYNDRPGLAARKKALSRAMHACRVAEQLGIETRVFVYGKAPQLADTVKILFR